MTATATEQYEQEQQSRKRQTEQQQPEQEVGVRHSDTTKSSSNDDILDASQVLLHVRAARAHEGVCRHHGRGWGHRRGATPFRRLQIINDGSSPQLETAQQQTTPNPKTTPKPRNPKT